MSTASGGYVRDSSSRRAGLGSPQLVYEYGKDRPPRPPVRFIHPSGSAAPTSLK
ncbi:hypothetical protein IMZ48_02260 [Candidatus Bathyarchaeota archaeon]|nr:hypothetical protein [Candidatus Bathyarchaeota archaeon]